MSLPSIFISYNPQSDLEQTLAVRLHTIGIVNGFKIHLPERTIIQTNISPETVNRIRSSDFFVVFSTQHLSKIVLDEIKCAFSVLHNKSKIIVIYDKRVGRNLSGTTNCTEVYIDPSSSPQNIINEITSKIKTLQNKPNEDALSGLGGLILTGLGLFALASIFSESTPAPRRKRKSKKTATQKKTAKKISKVTKRKKQ